MYKRLQLRIAVLGLALAATTGWAAGGALAQGAIDNSALSSTEFREHKRTFGLVYTLPQEVNDLLAKTIGGPLREKLLNAKLYDEAQRFNIPHVTVLHIHNPDPTTPEKMLKALPKLPAELKLVLKNFYTTEAAKGAGHPWWLDLGIVKEGPGYDAMMAFNTAAVPPLTALRDGPLPRVTGPVYAVMGDAAKELVRTVGVSGLNTVKDGTTLTPHNPHNTLVYSMAKFTPEIQAAFDQTAKEFNQNSTGRYPDDLQDSVDCGTRVCWQRTAGNLSHRSQEWFGARCRDW